MPENKIEQWKAVTEPDFRDLYLVSNYGRIARILKPKSPKKYYKTIIMSKKGRAYRAYRLHQLVSWAFNGPQPHGTVINHRDGCKTNDVPENLEYISQKQNCRHAVNMGLRKIRKSVQNGRFLPLLNESQVGEIKALIGSNTPVGLLAEEYGVSIQAIRNIKKGRNWNRVPAKP